MVRVCKGKQEENEEDHTQEVKGEDGEALRVLEGCADGRKAHIVTEGMAQHRAHQMTSSEKDECCVSSKHSCV